jgi:hypothetical protein
MCQRPITRILFASGTGRDKPMQAGHAPGQNTARPAANNSQLLDIVPPSRIDLRRLGTAPGCYYVVPIRSEIVQANYNMSACHAARPRGALSFTGPQEFNAPLTLQSVLETAGWEPVSGFEPLACRLQVAWPRAPGALPARMPQTLAAMALISPASASKPVHEPVHDSLRRSPDANY